MPQAAATAFPSAVLVVDDEPVVLQVFSRVLGEHGLVARTAATADEAIQLLDREGFACVLADKNLPGMDGIELVRRVRQAQPYCACIIMTGYASKESAVEALRLGAADYLEKPFEDLDVVVRRVDEAIRGMRMEFERQAVLARLRGFHRELSEGAEEDPFEEPVELPTPVEILEARVRQATADLQRRCLHLLSRLVASKSAGRDVLLSAEKLLLHVRSLQQTSPSEALAQIERLLDEHLALAREAQNR